MVARKLSSRLSYRVATRSEVFELVEEALDEVAVAVEEGAEGRDVLAVWHRLDVGPGAACGEGLAQGVAVVGAVGQQDLAGAKRCEHVLGAAAVMGLAFGELRGDRQTVGVDQGMDLGGQAAARATHATGSVVFFWALAACWCTRIEEESIIWMSPS